MKILHLSDLHRIIDPNYYPARISEQYKQTCYIKKIVEANQPNVVVITGDIFEDFVQFYYKHRYMISDITSPYIKLRDLIGGNIPVIFCLGNHEFAYHTIEETKEAYSTCRKADNVYCLDICGHVTIDDINFVGNVLWYDGKCSQMREDGEQKCNHIEKNWLDSTIEMFDPIKYNKQNIEQIKLNINIDKINVLLTHTVPYWKLNVFNYDQPFSVYNIYSGMNDLFNDYSVDVDYAFCGHTHRKSILNYKTTSGKNIECYNCGSDYNNFECLVVEIN